MKRYTKCYIFPEGRAFQEKKISFLKREREREREREAAAGLVRAGQLGFFPRKN